MATQSTKYSPLFAKIVKSRNILLNILKDDRGYDISDYENTGIEELRSMWENKQLDMLVTHKTSGKKIYIKYFLDTRIKASNIYDMIEDIFELENTLSNDDELIIINKDKLNDTIKTLLEQIYLNDKKFINILDINNYLFNILRHKMVPLHHILNEDEKNEVMKEYYISDESKFPEISRFDPVAMTIGLRPGELVKIIRSSPTAITSTFYRLCL
tara:strand:+ start:455 stop:1096 length:642 start_codon:yes stop_codon:yes gene_type:complete